MMVCLDSKKIDEILEHYKSFGDKRIYIEKSDILVKLLDWCNPNRVNYYVR